MDRHRAVDLRAAIARRRILLKDVAAAMELPRRRLSAILSHEHVSDEVWDKAWAAIVLIATTDE